MTMLFESVPRRRVDPREPITEVSRTDGQVVFRAVVDSAPPGAPRAQRRRTFATRELAREWIAQVRRGVSAGTLLARPQDETLMELVERYLATLRDLRPSTVRRYRQQVGRILDLVGSVRVVDLTHGAVQSAVHVLEMGSDGRKPVGGATVSRVLTILGGALDLAMRDDLIRANPARGVRRAKRTRHTPTIWEPSTSARFVEHIAGHRFEAGLLLSVAGLRRSEVLGLRWDDVQAAAGTISVRRSRVAGEGVESETGHTKSEASRRVLPLLGVFGIGPALAAEAARQTRVGQFAPEGFIVVNDDGVPVHPDAYSRIFEAAVKSSALVRITLHELRHSAASALLAAGVEPITVAGLLGHSVEVLLNNYARALPHALDDAAAQLGRLYAPRSA